MENFYVVDSSANVDESDPYSILNPDVEGEWDSLLNILIEIYPKVRYSQEKKKLFCDGVINYMLYWGVGNATLTDMMASCDAETFKHYSFMKDFTEIKNGFLWWSADAKFYNDLRLYKNNLFCFKLLLFKQMKW